jgi:hypothetical protein
MEHVNAELNIWLLSTTLWYNYCIIFAAAFRISPGLRFLLILKMAQE